MSNVTLNIAFFDATPVEAEQCARHLLTMRREVRSDIEAVASRTDRHDQSISDPLSLFAQTIGDAIVHHARVLAENTIGAALLETIRHASGPLGTKFKVTNATTGKSSELDPDGKTDHFPPLLYC